MNNNCAKSVIQIAKYTKILGIKSKKIGDIVMTRYKCVDCNKSFTALPHPEYTHVCEDCTLERNADMERWYQEQDYEGENKA